MQDTDKSEAGIIQLDLNKGFKLKVFDMWKFKKVENQLPYPHYEISYSSNTVYLSSNIDLDKLKKVVFNSVKDICMVNYGGGRENPFIEWLSNNTELNLIIE